MRRFFIDVNFHNGGHIESLCFSPFLDAAVEGGIERHEGVALRIVEIDRIGGGGGIE